MRATDGFFGSVVFWLVAAAAASPNGSIQNVTECSCGYYDPLTRNWYTDSAIVYFNETTTLPSDVFAAESYENRFEKGWNTRYTQGAHSSNVAVGKDDLTTSSNTSLRLYADPSDHLHHVVGGAVQTVRRDIFYGSFRALMRSPRSWSAGSALSMTLHFNESQTINFDLMNPDDPAKAWVGMFIRNEFPDRDLGVNYTTLANSSNGVLPWDYTEYRLDWSEEKVEYYIGGKPFRTVLKDGKKNYPQTPAPLRLKHWSVGNWFTMQGPPVNRSEANVGWVRTFFNSSLTTDQDRGKLLLQCKLAQACSTDNMALRGSTPFYAESVADWRQAELPRPDRMIPKVLLISCGALSGFLVVNALLRRLPHPQPKSKLLREVQKLKGRKFHPSAYGPSVRLTSEQAMAVPSPPLSRPISYFGDTTTPTPLVSRTPLGASDFSLGDYLHGQKSVDKALQSLGAEPTPKRPRLSWREFSDNVQSRQQSFRISLPRTALRHDRGISDLGPKGARLAGFPEYLGEKSENDSGPDTISPVLLPYHDAEKTALPEDITCATQNHNHVYAVSGDRPAKPARTYSTMRSRDDRPFAETFCPRSKEWKEEVVRPNAPTLTRRKTPY